jgi:FMN phosphatase YigB (HAD superfamily)
MQNIAFDLWGTLAYLKPGEDFGITIARELGINKEEYHNLVKKFWFKNCLEPREFAEILIKHIQSPYGRHSLYPDSLKSLERLSRDRQLLLVSDTSSLGKRMFYDLEISHFFRKLYFSCDKGMTKEGGLYSRVLEDLEIQPQEILVVGDSINADYNVPLNLGSRAILIDRNNQYPEEQSIKSLEELR